MKPVLIDQQLHLKDSIHVKQVSKPYLDTPFHFHNAYELVWVQKGSGHRIVGDHIENFDQDDLIMMGPDLPHVWYNGKDYYEAGSTQVVNATVVYFRPDWLTETTINSAELTRLRDLLKDLKRGIKISGAGKPQIITYLRQLSAASSLEKIIALLSMLNLLCQPGEYECLSSIGYVNSHNQKDVSKIDSVYQYIMMHYTDKILLEDIARIANITPTAFCKYFKKRTQKTFANFVNEVRIGYACKLLCNDTETITEIAYKSGFYNPTNFNKNFKLFVKMSPGEYRNKLRR
jgi:AraC-like DNA-binding protein